MTTTDTPNTSTPDSPSVRALLEAAAAGNVSVGEWAPKGAAYVVKVGAYQVRFDKQGRLAGYWNGRAGIDGRDCRGNYWLARLCATLATGTSPHGSSKATAALGLRAEYRGYTPKVAEIRAAIATYADQKVSA